MNKGHLRTACQILVIAAATTLTWFPPTHAETVISPLEYDFGEVALGETSTTLITITIVERNYAGGGLVQIEVAPDDTGFGSTAPPIHEFEHSEPRILVDMGGTLYFMADDGATGRELWRSDGTSEGTTIVKDLRPGSPGSSPNGLTDCGGTLYFRCAPEATNYELCTSDGTGAGTAMLADINPDGASDPGYFHLMDGVVYFQADDGTNGIELWRSDGTEARTYMVADIRPGGSSGPSDLTSVNGVLYFEANDGVHGRELWKSDGTAAGTVLVKDINLGLGSSVIHHLTPFQGLLFFTAYQYGYGQELWRSDGTEEGTVRVKDILPGNPLPSHTFPWELTVVGDTLFFATDDGVTGRELWKSDGTEEGTVLVRDIMVGDGNGDPRYLTDVNGTLFFSAGESLDWTSASQLWKSDGTEEGTVLVKNMNSYLDRYVRSPNNLTAVGATVFFQGEDETSGIELWMSDGTEEGTVLVRDIDPVDGSYPRELTASGGALYFVAYDPIYSRELFRTDGTEDGTGVVADVRPGGDPFIEVDVTFAPTSAGPAEAYLVIFSDGYPDLVPLRGNGVADEPTPAELIVDILVYFDAAVADGTLEGRGPGNSAANRLKALSNMLDSARNSIDAGNLDEACDQLRVAYRKTDGQPRPPDFVQGDAAAGLAAMILDLRTLLECE